MTALREISKHIPIYSIVEDMDLLDDFDFDLEEVIRHTDGSSSLEAAPVANRLYTESSANQIPSDSSHYEEIRINQPATPEEQFVDTFEDLDDAALDEALQHTPADLSHQNPSHGYNTRALQYTDGMILSEDMHTLENVDDQAPFQAKHRKPSLQMSDTLHGKVLQFEKGLLSLRTSENEHYMSIPVDRAFDEASYREQDLRSLQIPEQSSTSSHGQVLPQQPARDAELQVDHEIAIGTASLETSLRTPPIPSHNLTTSKQPGEDSISTQALSEALQYAYECDLTSDYLLKSFSITHLLSPLVQRTISAVNGDGLTDHSHLTEAEIPNPIVLDKFKTLATTPEALRLVAETRLVQSEQVIQSLTEKVSNANKLTHMKLEIPILRTDNERDMDAFQERSLNRSKALMGSIKEHRLPLHPQSLADGEGMELSSKARAECVMIQKKSEEERIGVTKESLTYLFSLLKDEYTTEDRMRHIIDEIKYKKVRMSQQPFVRRCSDRYYHYRHQGSRKSLHQPVPNLFQNSLRRYSILSSFLFSQTNQFRFSATTSTP